MEKHRKIWKTMRLSTIDVHLWKSQGLIPHYVNKKYGFDVSVVTYKNGDYPSAKQLENVKLEFVKKKYGDTVDGILYIINNAKKIDYLYMYHPKWETLICVFLYKMINPRGKVWLDLDASLHWFEYRKKSVGQRIQTRMRNWIIKNCCTIVTTSSSKCAEMSKKEYGRKDILHIPRGCQSIYSDLSQKRDIILTVGRLGTEQKNTELLINAFVNNKELHNWELVLIGEAEPKFLQFLQKKVRQHKMEDRIHYIGNINEREKLAEWYAKAKIFVLPSRWESYGIVLAEALLQGAYLVISDSISSKEDILGEKQEIGITFKNNRLTDLEKALVESIQSEYIEEEWTLKRRNYAREKWDYGNILDKIPGWFWK